MKQRTRWKRSTAGFTLIEMLVVILIIAVLFAIAAPGWDAILGRQRISTARDQILQALKQTQSDARNTRSPRIIVFEDDNGKPRFATSAYVQGTTTPTNWQRIGEGTVQPGILQLTTNVPNGTIIFDSNGAIAQVPIAPATQTVPLKITVRGSATAPGPKRCVVVETLIGGTRLAEGDGADGCD